MSAKIESGVRKLTSVQSGVLITPGATAVTRIPNRDSRDPRLRTNPEIPCFEAMYYQMN